MNNIFSFVLGAAFGAIVALLYAPQSGEELRTRIQEEASAERQRVQARYDQGLQDLRERVDQVHGDVQTLLEKSEALGDGEAEIASS